MILYKFKVSTNFIYKLRNLKIEKFLKETKPIEKMDFFFKINLSISLLIQKI